MTDNLVGIAITACIGLGFGDAAAHGAPWAAVCLAIFTAISIVSIVKGDDV